MSLECSYANFPIQGVGVGPSGGRTSLPLGNSAQLHNINSAGTEAPINFIIQSSASKKYGIIMTKLMCRVQSAEGAACYQVTRTQWILSEALTF